MLLYPDHIQNWIDYGYGLVIFVINFSAIFDLVKRVKFGVSRHFLKNHWGNGRKFCMMMYPDHFQNWYDFGYSLLIFLILMLFWLGETGKIWGFPDILFVLCGFSSLWWPFGWNWSYFGFLGIIWRTCGSKCREEGGGIFPTLCVECCLVRNISCNRMSYKLKTRFRPINCFLLSLFLWTLGWQTSAAKISWLGLCEKKYCLLGAGKVLWKHDEPFLRNVPSKIVF